MFRKALQVPRIHEIQRGLIVALAHQGKYEETRTEIEIYRALSGAQSVENIRERVRRFTIDDDYFAMYMEVLRLAGFE